MAENASQLTSWHLSKCDFKSMLFEISEVTLIGYPPTEMALSKLFFWGGRPQTWVLVTMYHWPIFYLHMEPIAMLLRWFGFLPPHGTHCHTSQVVWIFTSTWNPLPCFSGGLGFYLHMEPIAMLR